MYLYKEMVPSAMFILRSQEYGGMWNNGYSLRKNMWNNGLRDGQEPSSNSQQSC